MVVDDELPIRQLLRSWLIAHGYSIQEACTGKDVIERAPAVHPDVILMDLGLPDLDGIEVTRRLRQVMQTPIIILSVRSSAADKVAALDAGADDYLTKPWLPGELLERIRTALLHTRTHETAVFEAGDLKVDLNHRMVQVSNKVLQLTPGEYELLSVLVHNAGRLLTQRRLIQEVWRECASDQSLQLLRATINSLRQKLETNPALPRYIATEPGVGYRLRTAHYFPSF